MERHFHGKLQQARSASSRYQSTSRSIWAPVETVFHELVSDKVHIDVHLVKPTNEFPYVRLVTSGMSDLPMRTPEDPRLLKYAELLVTLPADWRLTQSDMQDERWYWPLRLLKVLARLPHEYQTWLGWGHTVPNGDPATPYAESTKFCGALVIPSVTVPNEFHTLAIPNVKDIAFYAVVPLYDGEMNLKLRSGLDALLERDLISTVSQISSIWIVRTLLLGGFGFGEV